MGTLVNIVTLVMLIVTGASIIAAITPTPKDDKWIGKLYKLIDMAALNIGKAKDRGNQDHGWSNYIKTEKYLKRNTTTMFSIKEVFGYALHTSYSIHLEPMACCKNV